MEGPLRRAGVLTTHLAADVVPPLGSASASNWAEDQVARLPELDKAWVDFSIPAEARDRRHYKFFFDLPTRWNDNSQMGCVGDVKFYSYFDTAISKYLIQRANYQPYGSSVVGKCVHTNCTFTQYVSFPDVLHVGLSVAQMSESSVVYNVAIFKREIVDACAYGQFIRVFTDKQSGSQVQIPRMIRDALQRLILSNQMVVTPDSGGASMQVLLPTEAAIGASNWAPDQVSSLPEVPAADNALTSITSLPSEARYRSFYKFFFDLPSRWNDNDQFGYVNHVIFYSLFTTAIRKYLFQRAAYQQTSVVANCVHSDCTFTQAVSFPDVLHVGLSVAQMSECSVVYNVAMFKREVSDACAYGRFIHVFTEQHSRSTSKATPSPIPTVVRDALQRLILSNEMAVTPDSGGATFMGSSRFAKGA